MERKEKVERKAKKKKSEMSISRNTKMRHIRESSLVEPSKKKRIKEYKYLRIFEKQRK